MMTDKEYNDFFRSRLDDFSSGVSDKLWQNINAGDKKSNRLWLLAKYILPVVFLMMTVKTADKMETSSDKKMVAYTTTLLFAKTKDAIAEKQEEKTEGANDKQQEAELLNSTGHQFINKKQKQLKAGTAKDLHEQHSALNHSLINVSPQTQSYNSTDHLQEQTKDSTINTLHLPAASKPDNLKKQVDSAADVTVETHDDADRWFLYLFASPDVAFAHVAADNSNYEQLRNQQAKQQFSYTAGAKFRININNHLSGNVGVQYSVVNQRVELTNSISNNHYRSLDVPLIFGYKLYKKRLGIEANAGIIVNINSSYSGYISSINNDAIDIHKVNVYSSNTSVSYYGGVQVLFNPNKRTTAFAEPYFKYQPRSITNSFQPFEEHVQKAGVLLGIRYRLKK